MFNVETFIIGLYAGLIGIGITEFLLIPCNVIIHNVIGTELVNAVVLILLALIGVFIPAKKAAKKDPATALEAA